MFRKKKESEPNWVDATCPVCKKDFGWRDSTKLHGEHCDECKAEISWVPGQDKPIMKLDKHKSRQFCSRGVCHCH